MLRLGNLWKSIGFFWRIFGNIHVLLFESRSANWIATQLSLLVVASWRTRTVQKVSLALKAWTEVMIILDLVHDQVSHYKLGLTSRAIFFLNETILLRPKSRKKVRVCLSKTTVILIGILRHRKWPRQWHRIEPRICRSNHSAGFKSSQSFQN